MVLQNMCHNCPLRRPKCNDNLGAVSTFSTQRLIYECLPYLRLFGKVANSRSEAEKVQEVSEVILLYLEKQVLKN